MVEVLAALAEWIHQILSLKVGGISFYALALVGFIGAAIKLIIDATVKK